MQRHDVNLMLYKRNVFAGIVLHDTQVKLSLKAPVTTAADDIVKYIFYSSDKKRPDIVMNRLRLTCKVKPYFVGKLDPKNVTCHILEWRLTNLIPSKRVSLFFSFVVNGRLVQGRISTQ